METVAGTARGRSRFAARELRVKPPRPHPPTSDLYAPRTVHVRLDGRSSRPTTIDGGRVESVREEWLVEDRWWSAAPLRRHYLELVLEGGRCIVVYRDLVTGGWWAQR